MRILKSLAFIFVGATIALLIQNATASQTTENKSPSQIQRESIDNSNYHNDNELLLLRDKSIKAMIDWSRTLTGDTVHTEIFVVPVEVVKGYIHEGIPYSEQEERINKEIEEYDKEHPYSDYPLYECCDIEKLLSENYNLFQVATRMRDRHDIEFTIKALIPVPEAKKTCSLEFYYVKFEYFFTLDIITNEDSSPNKRNFAVNNIKNQMERFYLGKAYERNKNISPSYLKEFKWRLTGILPGSGLKKITFNKSDLPKSVNDLFIFNSKYYISKRMETSKQ